MRNNNTTIWNTWGIIQARKLNDKKQLKQIMTENKTTLADMGNKGEMLIS